MITHRQRVRYGRAGGRARANSLSKKRRHEIAVAGGLARQLRARIAKEIALKTAQERTQ